MTGYLSPRYSLIITILSTCTSQQPIDDNIPWVSHESYSDTILSWPRDRSVCRYVFLLDKKALVLEWPNPGVKGLSQALRQQERKVKRVTRRLARRGCQGQAQGQGQGQTGKNKEKVKGKSKPRELTKRKRKGLRAELRRKGRSGREWRRSEDLVAPMKGIWQPEVAISFREG